MKKNILSLNDLKIKSFVTSNKAEIRGGNDTAAQCGNTIPTCLDDWRTGDACHASANFC